MAVEPVPGEPAAVAEADGDRLLLLADYHAGIELGLRRDGVELRSNAEERLERLVSIVEGTRPDRVVVLGDLGHAIGDPYGDERDELERIFDRIEVPMTVAKGNHDGDIEHLFEAIDGQVTLTPSHGARIGSLGVVHGHTWPSPAVLEADVVCIGHEHPVVRLEDEVGGHRAERAWLRGDLNAEPFEANFEESLDVSGELVVFPAFNDISGGTWINVDGQEFLSPFLPDGIVDGEAYLLDGMRLGPYRDV